MVVWRQLRNSSDLDCEPGLSDSLWKGDHELGWSTPVSCKPIQHPRVGVMLRYPGTSAGGMALPVRVDEPLCVLVLRIACVSMLERRLDKRKQQAHYHAEVQ